MQAPMEEFLRVVLIKKLPPNEPLHLLICSRYIKGSISENPSIGWQRAKR